MKRIKDTKLSIMFLALFLGTALMIASVFMPYVKIVGDRAEYWEDHPDVMVYEEVGMTAKDMMGISMVEYARIYLVMGTELFGELWVGVLYFAIIAAIGVFSLLAAIVALARMPIGVIIFDVLAFGTFNLLNWDFKDRCIIPADDRVWGAGYYFFFVGAIVVFVLALVAAVYRFILNKRLPPAPKNRLEDFFDDNYLDDDDDESSV